MTSTANTSRWFPGWTMVGIAAGAFFVSAPGQSYSVAAFKEPMRDALGLTDTQFSFAYTVATIVSGMLLPVVGWLLDRLGASRVLPRLTLLLGAACCGMAGVGGIATLCLGLCCVRSLGQGAMTLSGNWLVGEWFVLHRGFATAIAGLGSSLSVLCIPLFNEWMITAFGWRIGWLVLAAGVWGLMLLPSFLSVRDRPEELGLRPDGDAGPVEAGPVQAGTVQAGTVQAGPVPASSVPKVVPVEMEATETVHIKGLLTQPQFWLLLAPIATCSMVLTGLVFHTVSLLGERGLSPRIALSLISAQAMVSLLATPFIGWLTDRFHAKCVLIVSMISLMTGPLLLFCAGHTVALVVYVLALGLSEAANRTAGVIVWLEYYGRQRQGVIRGLAMAGMVLGAAAGPLPLAAARDYFDSYDIALVAFSVTAALAGVAVGSVRRATPLA